MSRTLKEVINSEAKKAMDGAYSLGLEAGRKEAGAEIAKLQAEIERLTKRVEEPDWFWRELDPDDSGVTIEEALRHVGEGLVCAINSSFRGPVFFAAVVPVLDPESDDTEVIQAKTEADCKLAVIARLKAHAAMNQAEGE